MIDDDDDDEYDDDMITMMMAMNYCFKNDIYIYVYIQYDEYKVLRDIISTIEQEITTKVI